MRTDGQTDENLLYAEFYGQAKILIKPMCKTELILRQFVLGNWTVWTDGQNLKPFFTDEKRIPKIRPKYICIRLSLTMFAPSDPNCWNGSVYVVVFRSKLERTAKRGLPRWIFHDNTNYSEMALHLTTESLVTRHTNVTSKRFGSSPLGGTNQKILKKYGQN